MILSSIVPVVVFNIIIDYCLASNDYASSMIPFIFRIDAPWTRQYHYKYRYCHKYASTVFSLGIFYDLINADHVSYDRNTRIIYYEFGDVEIDNYRLEYDLGEVFPMVDYL